MHLSNSYLVVEESDISLSDSEDGSSEYIPNSGLMVVHTLSTTLTSRCPHVKLLGSVASESKLLVMSAVLKKGEINREFNGTAFIIYLFVFQLDLQLTFQNHVQTFFFCFFIVEGQSLWPS